MKPTLAVLLVLGMAVPALAAALDSWSGVYKDRFPNGLADGSKYTSENVLEIVKLSPGKTYFRAYLEFFNGHTCDIDGIAMPEDGQLVFRGKGRMAGCVLTIARSGDRISFRDPGQSCKKQSCGARGSFDQVTFPAKSRKPIRYMKRLLASREYADAIAEDNGTKK